MSHHVGVLDSGIACSPSSWWLWFFASGDNYGPYCYICLHGRGQFYVNTSFHDSKAKPRTGLWSQQVCASFHKNGSKLSICCATCISPAWHVLPSIEYSAVPMWASFVFLLNPGIIFIVSHGHTVTAATGPSPFLLVRPLLARCCSKSSLYVLDTSSCATGASQMFPHSLCLFFHLRYLS